MRPRGVPILLNSQLINIDSVIRMITVEDDAMNLQYE